MCERMKPAKIFSRWRTLLSRFVIVLGVVVVGLGLLLAFTFPIRTQPFRDAQGNVLPNSIAKMEKVNIGGLEQMLWFRGVNTENPALILLHGGPGTSESALFRSYVSELEQHFLVVYWEQRGAGRSFSSDIPPETMTMKQFVSDLDELVTYVKQCFSKDQVILLGHSWGSAIGMLYTFEHPERVAAYIGTGQVANVPTAELFSYRYALSEAKQRDHQQAVAELERIGEPPHTVSEMLTSRKWVETFGGSFHSDMDTGNLIWAALQTSEASWWDIIQFGRGNAFSLKHLWPEFRTFNLDEHYLEFDVPIFFLLGRYDWQVPATVAAAYFEKLEAPHKELIWFEASAHNPPFEEPEKFVSTLVEEVLPLVQ
jgi:proline iminopeptidase